MDQRQGGDGVGIGHQCAAVGLDVVLTAGIVGDVPKIGAEERIFGQTRVSRVVSNLMLVSQSSAIIALKFSGSLLQIRKKSLHLYQL